MKIQKKITISWRDENYGAVYRSVAFRAEVEPWPSETAQTKLARIYGRCGFKVNHTRAAWIAEYCKPDAPARLAKQLTAAGYTIEHQGCFRSLEEAAAAASRAAA